MEETVIPLELIDKCIGTRISILTKAGIEFCGILRGFDDYLTIVLEDVTEWRNTPEGKECSKVSRILLNGKHICMLIPGGIDDHKSESE